jgi:hypothetical protein
MTGGITRRLLPPLRNEGQLWDKLPEELRQCEWWNIYDAFEKIFSELQAGHYQMQLDAASFQAELNQLFEREGIGWQLVDGELRIRGDEAFEANVRAAIAASQLTGKNTAKKEIHQALQDLSRRPTPDLTGAVQHAMAALECVSRDVTGDSNATLGDILKKHVGMIPKPLDTAVEKAWGFASEKGRHIKEGGDPEQKDVELIVRLSATVIAYLVG